MKGHRFLWLVDTHKHQKAAEKDFSRGSLSVSLLYLTLFWLSKLFIYLNNLRSQLVQIRDILLYSMKNLLYHGICVYVQEASRDYVTVVVVVMDHKLNECVIISLFISHLVPPIFAVRLPLWMIWMLTIFCHCWSASLTVCPPFCSPRGLLTTWFPSCYNTFHKHWWATND